MKHIVKNQSSQEFEDYKQQNPTHTWDAFPSSRMPDANREVDTAYFSKVELKESLLNEQGFICCYCQCELKLDHKTRIEHYHCRANHHDEIFEYANLFAVCEGKKRSTDDKMFLHCDSKKGDDDITVSPLQPDCASHFRYDDQGKIYHESNAGEDAIEKLGLDIPILDNFRKDAIEGFLPPANNFTALEYQQLRNRLAQRTQGKFEPYCQVIISLIS